MQYVYLRSVAPDDFVTDDCLGLQVAQMDEKAEKDACEQQSAPAE